MGQTKEEVRGGYASRQARVVVALDDDVTDNLPMPVVVPFSDEGIFTDEISLPLPRERTPRRPTSLTMLKCYAFINPLSTVTPVLSVSSSPAASFLSPPSPSSAASSLSPPSTPSTPMSPGGSDGFSEPTTPPFSPLKIDRSATMPTHASRSALRSASRARVAARKSVRFADALGLDLAQIELFCSSDEERAWHSAPTTPSPSMSPSSSSSHSPRLHPANFRYRSESETLSATRAAHVTVASIRGTPNGLVTGQVNVLNVAFDKQVTLRYTTDSWQTHSEQPATFSHRCFGAEDVDAFLFAVNLQMPATSSSSSSSSASAGSVACEFAVCYTTAGRRYWDNNDGANYVVAWTAASQLPPTAPLERNAFLSMLPRLELSDDDEEQPQMLPRLTKASALRPPDHLVSSYSMEKDAFGASTTGFEQQQPTVAGFCWSRLSSLPKGASPSSSSPFRAFPSLTRLPGCTYPSHDESPFRIAAAFY